MASPTPQWGPRADTAGGHSDWAQPIGPDDPSGFGAYGSFAAPPPPDPQHGAGPSMFASGPYSAAVPRSSGPFAMPSGASLPTTGMGIGGGGGGFRPASPSGAPPPQGRAGTQQPLPPGLLTMPPSPSGSGARGLPITGAGAEGLGAGYWKNQERARSERLRGAVVGLGLMVFTCAAALPAISAVVLLMDPTYVFWIGRRLPWELLAISLCAFVALIVVGFLLHRCGTPRLLDERAISWGAAAFAGLLGVSLLTLAVSGGPQRDVRAAAAEVAAGCTVANSEAMVLQGHHEVLAHLRTTRACSRRKSVEECKHWFDNRYTDYLRYLERDLHCGPYCPAKPAPVSLVQEHAAPTRRMKRGGHAAEPLSFLQQARDTDAEPSDSLELRLNSTSLHKARWFHIPDDPEEPERKHPTWHSKAPDDGPIGPGDTVRILADEAALRKAFTGRDDIVWHDGMTSMLGRTYRVWQMWGADAVGVRSPDGSQEGIWYFPVKTVKKLHLQAWQEEPQQLLFGPFGQKTRMVCAPLVSAQLESLVWFSEASIFWQGIALVVAAVLAGAAPLLAAVCFTSPNLKV